MIEELQFTILELHQQSFQPEAYVIDVFSVHARDQLERLKFKQEAVVVTQGRRRMPATVMGVNPQTRQIALILDDKNASLALGSLTLEVKPLPPYVAPHEDDPTEADVLCDAADLEEALGQALAILRRKHTSDLTPLETQLGDLIALYLHSKAL